MRVIADICVIPVGTPDVSISDYVVECESILQKAGFAPQVHAWGTNIEGEWEDVFNAVKQCHEWLHRMGVARIMTTVRVDSRTDKPQSILEKVSSVQEKLITRET